MIMIIPFLLAVLFWWIVLLISAIPLHIAVKVLGGKTTLGKTAMIMFVAGIVFGVISSWVDTLGTILAFIIMLWIYRESFQLKWWKAFVAWLLQFVFLLIIVLILVVVFGIAIGAGVLALL